MAGLRNGFAVVRAVGRCRLGSINLGSSTGFRRLAPVVPAQTAHWQANALSLGRTSGWWLQSARCFASASQKVGVMKMWNDEKGFGFITPEGGGEDVFVHRSALQEGCTLSGGVPVSYEDDWDDKRRKYRATTVQSTGEAPAPSSSSSSSSGGGGRQDSIATAAPREHHIVGSVAQWAISKEPMGPDGSSGKVSHRIVVRSDAPQAKNDKKFRREEFQICGDASWEKRLYPAGGDREEVIVLQPGETVSQATSGRGKGHGRNWAVEGRPGTAFDVLYDPEARSVTCELAFKESR